MADLPRYQPMRHPRDSRPFSAPAVFLVSLALAGFSGAPVSANPDGTAAIARAHAQPVRAELEPALEPQLELDEPSPPKLYEDNTTHLTGRLTNGKPGRRIDILVQRPGHDWRTLTSVRTGDDGEYAADFEPANPGSFSIRAERRSRHRVLTSPVRTLDVLDRKVTIATHASYQTFTPIVVSGRVIPAGPGRHVVIQRRVDGHWKSGAGAYTGSDGRYTVRLRHDLPGTWVVRAYWPGAHPDQGTAEYSPVHTFTVRAVLHPVLGKVSRKQLGGSYHTGCPVGPSRLRNLTITFQTFGDEVHRGTLVVRSTIVSTMTAAFGTALSTQYPILRIYPTARYGGSDVKSMYHDNTSAFNCRHVTGDPTRLSPHSYGTAVDIDPVENPYQDVHGVWWPRSKGQQFRDRSTSRPGMLYESSPVTEAFTSRGMQWGGSWSHPDYQHFDPNSTKSEGAGGHAAGVAGAGGTGARGRLWSRLPSAASLGAGWSAVSAASRPAAAAGRLVLPLGCADATPPSLPAPRSAVQGSYRDRAQHPAQVVVLRFGSAMAAREYFAGLTSALRRCTAPDGPSGVSAVVERTTPTSYAGRRVYGQDGSWREADAWAGAEVRVLLAKGPTAAG